MIQGLSTATVVVNNETVAIVPNSLTIKTGRGENVVKTETYGAGSVEPVVFENLETKKGYVKFSLYPKDTSLEAILSYKSSKGNNTILVITSENSYTFTNMALTNDPEINFSSDGEIELEFEGTPAR